MTKQVCSLVLAITSLMVVAPPSESQVIPMTMTELVTEAARIVRGEVVGQQTEKISTVDGALIVTLMTFRVHRTLKGEPRIQLLLEFPGGTVGDETLEVSGMATFELGDRAVLFLNDQVNPISPIVGYAQGHFAIETSNADDVVVLNDGTVLAGLDQVGRVEPPIANAVPRPPMTVGQFESEILRLVQSDNTPPQ